MTTNAAPKLSVERVREILRITVARGSNLPMGENDLYVRGAEPLHGAPLFDSLDVTLSELEAVCQQLVDAISANNLNEKRVACAHGNEASECPECESKCRAYGSCRCEGVPDEAEGMALEWLIDYATLDTQRDRVSLAALLRTQRAAAREAGSWCSDRWGNYSPEEVADIAALRAAAREAGRVEGLEEARKICEGYGREGDRLSQEYACETADELAERMRLAARRPGGAAPEERGKVKR